ncbi:MULTISPECIES: host attachment protein [Alteromonadales]|jgi:protein required for attachment to host cells|uniref:host attachment protein n=1 Tax=Alteromonadales TaxID=135622 RepID=UPI000C329894|nr:host attachment protein [Shewanella sp. Actino-trap-3]PKG77735.1 host attachment protein [Shewanella sp. Actino-trap-3]|tara:strand:+ start:54684 stop:55133 length:450 start_codon:yes stop_codon:yes gene_type:complete
MSSWILVADSAHARLFNAETAKSALNEIKSMIHPESRQHEQKLTSDLPGRQAGGATFSHHAVGGKTEPKEYEAVEFARDICRYLEAEYNAQKFSQLIVVAEPQFLGNLRKVMSDNVAKLITLEIDKDIVKQDIATIRGHLPTILPLLTS